MAEKLLGCYACFTSFSGCYVGRPGFLVGVLGQRDGIGGGGCGASP